MLNNLPPSWRHNYDGCCNIPQNWGMPNPPLRKNVQSNHIKTALRLPPDLHAEVAAAAEHNGRSMNAEIIARLRNTKSADVLEQLSELKRMVTKLIDRS